MNIGSVKIKIMFQKFNCIFNMGIPTVKMIPFGCRDPFRCSTCSLNFYNKVIPKLNKKLKETGNEI